MDIIDEGMMEINGAMLDVATASEQFSRAAQQANGDELAYQDCLRNAISAVGLQPGSHTMNHEIALLVWQRNKVLQKKFAAILEPEGVPGSPITTESIHSN